MCGSVTGWAISPLDTPVEVKILSPPGGVLSGGGGGGIPKELNKKKAPEERKQPLK